MKKIYCTAFVVLLASSAHAETAMDEIKLMTEKDAWMSKDVLQNTLVRLPKNYDDAFPRWKDKELVDVQRPRGKTKVVWQLGDSADSAMVEVAEHFTRKEWQQKSVVNSGAVRQYTYAKAAKSVDIMFVPSTNGVVVELVY